MTKQPEQHDTLSSGADAVAMAQKVDEIVAAIGSQPSDLLPLLHTIQQEYHYLPPAALTHLAEATDITPVDIEAVSTFYDEFRTQPAGRHTIRVCHGTTCHVKGAPGVTEAFRRHLQIADDGDTDAQRLFTVQQVACLGCCTLAPAVQIDEITYGHVTPDSVDDILDAFLRSRGRDGGPLVSTTVPENVAEIRIGLESCCRARGTADVYRAFAQAVDEMHLPVRLKTVGCVGMCYHTPLVEIARAGEPSSYYACVRVEDVRGILLSHFRPPSWWRHCRNRTVQWLDRIVVGAAPQDNGNADTPTDVGELDADDPTVAQFWQGQHPIATEHSAVLDPLDLDEYLANDGFAALRQCVTELTCEQVIERVTASCLRGRGGGGYPTGAKWAHVRAQPDPCKIVICNGDEGDPGAFMDRMLLESHPYRVIEGLAIAAYAVGAAKAYIYVRHEYFLARNGLQEALATCRQRGLLGERLFGSDLSLDIEMRVGAGAFVCGEETALIASIEGRRPTPRLRPPYPSEHGLFGAPTLVNNVETLAVTPWLIRHGADAFLTIGTDQSKGSKVFALAGKVERPGLIEVPMGITIADVVYRIGGGIPDGKSFKAVQIGGPSGGCVPATQAQTPIDYEDLTQLGAIMGSGGIVVLDEDDCMVELARYFLEFTQAQSCGKCTFCRIGTRHMLEILERLCAGQGRSADVDELHHLCGQVKQGSLCGLGRTAPNPVLTALRHFSDEFDAHLNGRCPALKCPALIRFEITDRCIGCTVCAQHCPVEAIAFMPYQQHRIDVEKCTRCGVCQGVCPADAIERRTPADVPTEG